MAEQSGNFAPSEGPNPTGCPSRDDLERFAVQGTGSDREAGHIHTCPSCRKVVEQIQRDNDLIRPFAAAARAEPDESQANTGLPTIDGYEILSEIHRGGQGVVYKAIQKATRRKVAVKMLLPGAISSMKHRFRFEREIVVVAKLRHPNIVTLYESGVTGEGRHYYAMEYLRGVPLDEFARRVRAADFSPREVPRAKFPASEDSRGLKSAARGRSDLETILRVFAKVCEAVQYAYQSGVIHRDLKPGNILVDSEGEPHVLDFGLAKTARAEMADEQNPATHTGEFLGTLTYAAPEQVRGLSHHADTRTDVYALGVMLYELLAGTLPYPVEGSLTAVIRNILEVDPVRPSAHRSGLDDDVDKIVLKALAKDRERRYQSAESMRRDILRFLANEPIDAKRDSTWYVVRKIVRRHKVACGVTAAFFVLVAAFAVIMTALAARNATLAKRNAAQRDELHFANTELADEQNAVRFANRKLQLETARATLQAGDAVRAESLSWQVYLSDTMTADAPSGGLVSGAMKPMDSYWALWDLYAQQPCVRTWKGHEGKVMSVDLSPDGRLLASAGYDEKNIKIWEVLSGREAQSIPTMGGSPRTLAFSPDGALLGWGTADGLVQIWHRMENRIYGSYRAGEDPVQSLAFHPQGDTVALCTGREIHLWSVATNEGHVLREHNYSPTDLCFDADGTRLASIDTRSFVMLWDVPTRRLVETFANIETQTDQQPVLCAICFHPDGKRLIAAIKAKSFEVGTYEIEKGAFRRLYASSDYATDMHISRDGRWLVTSSRDGRISFWDFKRNELGGVLAGHDAGVWSLVLSSDGSLVASAASDGIIKLWELERNQCCRTLAGHGSTVFRAQYSPNGRLLASSGQDNLIRIWNSESGEPQGTLAGHSNIVSAVTFDPSGLRLASGSHDKSVRIWDLPNRRCLQVAEMTHDKEISFVAWSPDGRYVASGSEDRTVKLWDPNTGECQYTFDDYVVAVKWLSFSPDGRWLASSSAGGPNGKIFLHDVATKASRLLADYVAVRALAFSPDGQWLASGHDGGQIRLWNVASGKQLDAWQAHPDDIFSLSFHPQRDILASASRGHDIKLWDARPAAKERYLVTLKGHENMVFSVCFSPDGCHLASGSADALVGLWDLTYYRRHIEGNRAYQLQRLAAHHVKSE